MTIVLFPLRRKDHLLPALLLGAWLLIAPLPASAQGLKTTEALRQAGLASKRLSRYGEALRFFAQARKLARASHDLRGEARALASQALVENDQDHKDKALADDQNALSLFRSVADRDGQAGVLSSMGDVQFSLSRYAESLSFYGQAGRLFNQVGDRAGEANTLSSQGNVFLALGDYARAMEDLGKALPILRQVRDRYGEAKALNNLGSVYSGLGRYDQAISRCRQALPLFRALNPDGYGKCLINLGNICLARGRNADALRFYQQALPIFRQVGDRYGEVHALTNIGDVCFLSRLYGKAAEYFQKVLLVNQIAGDEEGKGDALDNLRQVCQAQHQPALSIFYGKQAVNVYQRIRRDLQSLPRGTQKIYLGIHEDTYREMADLLIRQGRLPEAQQVLELLKQQELFEFLRGDAQATGPAGQTDLTPEEAVQEKAYAQIADQVIALGQQQQALRDKARQGTLTHDDQTEMDAVKAKLTTATHHLNAFYAQLAAAFSTPAKDNKTLQARLQAVKSAADLQSTLEDLHQQGQEVVVLQTLVAPDRCVVIVTTAQSQKVEQFPIKEEDLNKKVADLQTALRTPTVDPRRPAQALYDILVGPIEKDVAQSGAKTLGAKTLMWSLDGTLRYIPIAALYDGKQYLVERFNNEVFTLGSQSGFGQDTRKTWTGLGLGVSLAHTGFDPLPAVPDELRGVIQDEKAPAGSGVVPGTVLLDDPQFTQITMTHALEQGKYNLVHIASHFALRPDNPNGSFLLLGDGDHLSLAQMADDHSFFHGVDLLSLSACDTATSGAGSDGKEVDSLGTIAQQDGAKSVLASLWPVADASTRLLMQGFYRQHETQAGITKAEALRQAQSSLLHGNAPAAGDTFHRGTKPPSSPSKKTDLPAFVPDPKAPYAHPFYWAPFILIGNWR